jgi:LysM domain-containing protein
MIAPVDAEETREPVAVDPEQHEIAGRHRSTPSARGAVLGVCPYLVSAGGAWRSAVPSRDHRCGAVAPAATQSVEKQRRHCLASDHVDCAMFRAARSARRASLIAGADPDAIEAADRRRRPLARTAPILLEPPRLVDQAMRFQLDRTPGQIALIALMLVAFAVIALARLSSGGGTAPSGGTHSISPRASSSAPTPRGATIVPAVATSSPLASSESSATAGPSVRATYKVKRGDTLLGIARTFSTTVTKIRSANGMTSSAIKVGQVLKIP